MEVVVFGLIAAIISAVGLGIGRNIIESLSGRNKSEKKVKDNPIPSQGIQKPLSKPIEMLGNRRLFNAEVDTILRLNLCIVTDSSENNAFPGRLKYYEYIDEVWEGQGSVEHAAARIGCLYYMGLAKNGVGQELEECKALEPRLRIYLKLCQENKSVPQDSLNHYTSLIDKYSLS